MWVDSGARRKADSNRAIITRTVPTDIVGGSSVDLALTSYSVASITNTDVDAWDVTFDWEILSGENCLLYKYTSPRG